MAVFILKFYRGVPSAKLLQFAQTIDLVFIICLKRQILPDLVVTQALQSRNSICTIVAWGKGFTAWTHRRFDASESMNHSTKSCSQRMGIPAWQKVPQQRSPVV